MKHANYNDYAPPASGVANTGYHYKYNGQELQTELGLNLYDMPLRDYDPAIGRWSSMDPVVDFERSPYNGFDNNPVFWSDPTGAYAEYNWKAHDKGYMGLSNDGGKNYDYDGNQVYGVDQGSESDFRNTDVEAIINYITQVGLLPESFEFQNITSNWQAAGVTGLSLTVQNPKRQILTVDFELEVGIPIKLSNGAIISKRLAQIASAKAANETAAIIGTLAEISNGNFYKAPALVQKTFTSLMQKKSNESLKEVLELSPNSTVGGRVNSPVQSNIITKSAVWSNVSTFEGLKIWMKSWF